MALRALNPLVAFWYVPLSEHDAEHPTRFKIRGLNGTEQGYVSPELQIDEQGRSVIGMSGKGIELCLKYGLVDWENFDNNEGPVACVPANFAFIQHTLRVELAWKILGASFVSPAEKKT